MTKVLVEGGILLCALFMGTVLPTVSFSTPPETTASRSLTESLDPLDRRSIIQLISWIPVGFLSERATAEVDPFAAMDSMLSSDEKSMSFEAPTEKPQDDKGKAAASDMEAALEESSKKRKIDPRTHG